MKCRFAKKVLKRNSIRSLLIRMYLKHYKEWINRVFIIKNGIVRHPYYKVSELMANFDYVQYRKLCTKCGMRKKHYNYLLFNYL